MTLLRLFPVLCLALLGATNVEDAQRSRRAAFVFDGFESGASRAALVCNAERKLLQRLGRPDRSRSTTQWEGDGLFQTKYWYYEGLEIRTSRPLGAPDTWFRKISLTSPACKLKFGLSIGTRKNRFLKELGRPAPRAKPTLHSLVYYFNGPRSEGDNVFVSHASVEIFFDQDDRAAKIVWDYYAD